MEGAQEKFERVEKLKDDNYQFWAFQTKMLLQSKDLWDGVMDGTPVPARPGLEIVPVRRRDEEADAFELRRSGEVERYQLLVDRFNEHRRKDRKAMNYIALSVDRANANLIYTLESGVAAWIVLRDHHNMATLGSKLRAKKSLYSLKIDKTGSMYKHLNDMIELFNKLGDVDGPIPEDQKVTTILSSVEPHYNTATSAIMGWPEERLTVRNVREYLVEEWIKLKSEWEAKEVHHQKKMNDAKTEEEAGLAVTKKGPLCYNCKNYGHIARMCPEPKKNDLRRKLNENRNKIYEKSEDYTNCFFTELTPHAGWIIDSGATCHMASEKSLFSAINYNYRSCIMVANGDSLEAKGIGSVNINVETNDGVDVLKLKNVLWIPGLSVNLISVRKLVNEGFIMKFDDKEAFIEGKGMKAVIGVASKSHFVLNNKSLCLKVEERRDDEELCVHQWHRRLGHRNLRDIKQMREQGLKIKTCNCSDDCEHCMIGKMARKSFGTAKPVENVLDCVVSDVCGQLQVESLGRKRYFVTYTDVHSRYCHVEFIRKKSDVVETTIRHIERMKTQLGKKPKVFRSDKGMEYLDQKLQNYLLDEGIKFESTVGYCPEQNGIAERKNRTLMEAARSMLSDAKLPSNHWAEAVNTANDVTNRIVNQVTKKSPFEMMFNKKPNWNDLRAFGSEAYVMVPKEKRRKLDPKAVKMKFVGLDKQSKGYRMTNGKKVIVSREVRFLRDKVNEPVATDPKPVWSIEEYDDTEEELHQQQEIVEEEQVDNGNGDVSTTDDDYENAESESSDESSEEEEQLALRRSARANKGIPPAYLKDYVAVTCDESYEPKSYADAMKAADSEQWKEAMKEELESIEQNQTWELTDLPRERKAIGSKWVFKKKLDECGKVVRRKARLVAQGFSQKFGIDYDEVFAPVARGATLRLLLSVAGVKKHVVKQYDIKTAFLNGELAEEIYMKPPLSEDQAKTNGKVYRLKKSLYGLKQAARVWNQTLHESLVKNGCQQNETDNCLYSLTSGGDIVYLLIHVDDFVGSTNNEKLLDDLMESVGKDFELKCLGIAKSFLGIDLTRGEDGHYHISQEAYIAKIIESSGMTDAKPSKFPIDKGYYKIQGKVLESNAEYRKLVGMLLYLSTNTRPDIAASVTILSKRVANPRNSDLNELKRVVRYLKGTQQAKLRLSASEIPEVMFAYSDADWAEDPLDRKSHTGLYCSVNGGAIMWSCKKQQIVALSSAEAEYVALSETCKEVIWISRVARAFGIEPPEPINIYTDSQSAMAMIDNQGFSHRTKHVDTKFHFVKDMIKKGIVRLKYHPTATNIADMMTKPLGGNKMKQLRELAGVCEDVSRGN